MTGLRCVFIAAVVVAATAPARAESPEAEVERLANEAVLAYKGADYRRAVELLQRAYDIRQVPALLYNMAKAYDKLGDVDHAYESYKRYVASAAADPKLKTRAEARIAALTELRKQNAPEPPKPVEPPQPAVTPSPPPPSPEQLRAQKHDDFLRTRHRARLVALGVGAGSAAFAVVAIALSADALALQRDFDATTSPDAKARDKSDAIVRAGVADGFWAATAVGAAVTGYFLYLGYRHEPASLALVPEVSPTSAGVALSGIY